MTGPNTDARLSSGDPEPLGVTLSGDGINVAVFSAFAEAMEICLFDETGTREVERIRLPDRTGDVFHGHIAGIGQGARYGLRAHGPYDPHAGHRFNPAKLLVDPYALAIDRPFAIDPAVFGFVPATGQADPTDSAAVVPKAIVSAPTRAQPWSHAVAWERMVIAELHVRGFTKLHPGVPEAQRGTFAGLASPAAIAHFLKLGITTIEILPAAASMDERHLKPLGLTNYWNYNPVAFLAPDPRLAPGGWTEIREATATLNAAGIEVILDVVYNHSGEGDEAGPTVSLRGLDNASYYRLNPNDGARYINDAGCGNILAADRPWVVRLVLDALRAWAQYGGINGFRFDLAVTLGRRASGFEAGGALLSAIEQDPALRSLRMIAEPWDIGPGGYQVGAFSGRWGEWNDKYRDDVRRFWRGDGSIADLATRLSGSTDKFWFKRKPSRGINFVTAHDGFTLADLVSYQGKHNEANGEQNRDGTNDNYSWNNGAEGPTDNPAILEARWRDQRNLLATLLLSRGTPMLGPGSETGETQGGNNNAYAQENAISWIDWSKADGSLPGFIGVLNALRAANPALTQDRFLSGGDPDESGFPDVVWRMPAGQSPSGSDWHAAATATLVAVMSVPLPGAVGALNRIVAAFHAGRSAVSLTLPNTRAGCRWRLSLNTDTAVQDADRTFAGNAIVEMPARTVMLFIEEPPGSSDGKTGYVSPDVLDRLARAAGIAPEWFEVNGTRHDVSPDTKQALLAAMGLPAMSTRDARDRLDELATLRDRRVVPKTLSARANQAIVLPLVDVASMGTRRPALTIMREDGSQQRIAPDPAAGPSRMVTACDGRPVMISDLLIPPQPIGRHRIMVDDAAGSDCMLTVAPQGSYLPPDLAAGVRKFGIAAHLYTLRGKTDGGIGDFSILGEFSEASARHGAALVGINPLHALFANNRDRASPYNPSDRRFLDPIYLDVTTPEVLGEAAEVQAVLDGESAAVESLRTLRLVDYPKVWAAKKAVLEAGYTAFDARRTTRPQDGDVRDFDAFVASGGAALQRFAVFESISERFPDRGWMSWPAELAPDGIGIRSFAAAHEGRVRFHLYLQWLSERQLAGAVKRGGDAGLSIGLYRDLAVGCAPDGAEAWAEQDAYAKGVSVGSPPDPFSATGQIWSLPPPQPDRAASHRRRAFSASAGSQHAPCGGPPHRSRHGLVSLVLGAGRRAGLAGSLCVLRFRGQSGRCGAR